MLPLYLTFSETPRPNVTSPDTVKWSNSIRSGMLANRDRNSFTCIMTSENTHQLSATWMYTLRNQMICKKSTLDLISSASPLDCQEYIINCCFDMRCISSLPEVTWIELTFEKWLSPNLTRGVVGNILWGLITSDPFLRLYKLLITSSRSDVFLTGRNRLRGTLMPAIPILESQHTWLRWITTLNRQQMERPGLWEDHKM